MADLLGFTYKDKRTIINLDNVTEISIDGGIVTIDYTNGQYDELVDKNHNIQKYFMERLKREVKNEN